MRYCAVTLLVLTVSACASDDANRFTTADEDAIRSVVAAWDAAWTGGDIDAVVSLYDDQYVEMRSTAVVGLDAARELYAGMELTYTQMRSTVQRIEGEGDLAYAWLAFEARYTRADGAVRDQVGNGLWVFTRSPAGDWRLKASGFQARTMAPDEG